MIDDERDRWILDELHGGHRTFDELVQGWLDVMGSVADVLVRESVERLRKAGKIRVGPDDTLRLRVCPTTTMSIGGDPNFRRGGG